MTKVRRVWAIADTHLPGASSADAVSEADGKSMDRFGEQWHDHAHKIAENCARLVAPEDILLLPGDLSWATKRSHVLSDLAYLAALPGIKIAIKGNHDYWWESKKHLDYPGLLEPPQTVDNRIGFAGTRGWFVPEPDSENEKVNRRTLERERERLRNSLAAIADCPVKIALTHYPPQPFLPELNEAGVHIVAYGHVHVNSLPEDEKNALDGEMVAGIRFFCVACDRIDFTPRLIWEG